jgi:putative membrane protein
MGLADLIPGVSGGTIALISGIYEEFIESLIALHPRLLIVLKQEGVASFWKAANGAFLSSVFSGIITSIVVFSSIIQYLLNHHQVLLFAFFFGILLASVIVLRKRIERWNPIHLGILLLGALLSFLSTQMVPSPATIEPSYLFFCGFVAISAMILPGLSGAYILLVLGVYSRILSLLQEAKNIVLNWSQVNLTQITEVFGQLLVFVLGIILGLLTFSQVLRWFLKRFYSQTLAFLIGLIIGAIHKIWPWQIQEEFVFENKTRLIYTSVWPTDFIGASQWEWALLLFGMGIGILLLLERFKNQLNPL